VDFDEKNNVANQTYKNVEESDHDFAQVHDFLYRQIKLYIRHMIHIFEITFFKLVCINIHLH